MKDEKSAAAFHYIKTVSGKVVVHSNLVETVTARCASRDTLSRAVGQLDCK